MKLGDIIKEYRKANGLSQRDFAKLCNLSHTYISTIEKIYDPRSGNPVAPTIEVVKKIANGLKMPLKDLLDIIDNNQEFKINNDKIIDLSDLTDDEFKYIQDQINYIRWKRKT